MPPFIREKLEQLYSGCTSVDSNPTGAFDTDGWRELSSRLPKFAAVVSAIASTSEPIPVSMISRMPAFAESIDEEYRLLAEVLRPILPPRSTRGNRVEDATKQIAWEKAHVRLAQVVGVLRKCNRDLRSKHWKSEWKSTPHEVNAIAFALARLKHAARALSGRSKVKRHD